MNQKQFKRALKEVKKKMGCCGKSKKVKSNKGLWIGLAIGVITTLVGLVLWLRAKNDEDIEEYYEYFDDELEDELEDDLYGDEDEQDDEEDDVEYVEIRTFSDEEVDEEIDEALEESKTKE